MSEFNYDFATKEIVCRADKEGMEVYLVEFPEIKRIRVLAASQAEAEEYVIHNPSVFGVLQCYCDDGCETCMDI